MFNYSIIVTSKNKLIELKKLFNSINLAANISNSKIEVVLVIQSIYLVSFIEVLIIEYPNIFFNIIYENNISLSKARNIAIKNAKSDWLIVIDDDAYIEDTFFKILDLIIKKYSDTYVFSAKILDSLNSKPLLEIFNNESMYLHKKDFRFFMGSAHIVNKVVFKNIGLYNELLGAGTKNFSGEETDLFFRILEYHFNIFYNKDLIIYHPSIINQDFSKQINYLKGQGAIARILFNRNFKSLFSHNFIFLKPLFGYAFYSFFKSKRNNAGFRINLKKGTKLLQGFLEYRNEKKNFN